MPDLKAESGLLDRGLAPFVGLLAGGGAGAGVHLWLGAVHLSIAAAIMFAYAAGILVVAHRAAQLEVDIRRRVRGFPINLTHRRLWRLVLDRAFWWSLVFGWACMAGAAWFGGIREPMTLGLIGVAWGLVDVLLSYELTLLQPTTRCRRCFYQLLDQLDPNDPEQSVRCPECGSLWTKRDLCLGPGLQRKRHRSPHRVRPRQVA